MNNNKQWYEKINIWIGIIAGICTIIAFIYSLGYAVNTNSNTTTDFNNYEAKAGDQSAIIFGDNNTINYGSAASDDIQNTKRKDSLASDSDSFSVIASQCMSPIQNSEEGIDVLVTAITSFPADNVTISSLSDADEEVSFNMYGDTNNWWFNANFYIKGTYTVTITAYTSDGRSVSDTFTYVY